MENLFLSLYRFFKRQRLFFWIVLLTVSAVLILRSLSVRLEEDITRIFPNDKRVEKLDYVFRNSRMSEKLVMMVSVKDSSSQPQPDQLVEFASRLADSIARKHPEHIRSIQTEVDDGQIVDIFRIVQERLPVFLDDHDYQVIDSLANANMAKNVLEKNYRQLISPSGIVTKNLIVKDPLGISFLVLKKLQQLQYGENFELFDNYIVTRDHRHLLFFIHPKYSPDDTGNNIPFLDELQTTVRTVNSDYPELEASYFGASVVAAGNARQLQRDTILTVSLTVVLLMVVLLGFFRKKRIPFLILMPVVFGALFSLTCISFIQSSLSILALAVGAVILGVAVDYALHYLVLLKDLRKPEEVIKGIVKPLTIGSSTTVLAFLCLNFTNAAVLRDIGLFSAFSLIGAALCSLIFLPHITGKDVFSNSNPSFVTRLTRVSYESKKPVVYGILLLTPVFFYFASDVKFNADMGSLNFMTDETRIAEKRLERINQASLSAVYIVSSGNSLEKALRKNELANQQLRPLLDDGTITRMASVSGFLISDSLQHSRIQRWNEYWTNERKTSLSQVVETEAAKLGFSPVIARNFDTLLQTDYQPLAKEETTVFSEAFFNEYIIEKDSLVSVISLANVFPENRPSVYSALEGGPAYSFDRRMLTNLFIEYVNADFTYIVSVTSLLVFFALLLAYGRIELTLISFVPMLFTWVWILGIMALVGIEFNIVNVMVSTFIFGLGDDYSIFTMDGLLEEYRASRTHLASIRTSILLSAFTTISGLGVLIFAQHPALRSIAAISIIGIACVFIMSQTLEPYLFRILVTNRTTRGLPPMTFKGIVVTIYTYAFFVFGSFFLTIVGLGFKCIPFARTKVQFIFHWLLSRFTRTLVYGAFNLRISVVGRRAGVFNRPSIIVCNHSSFLDILLTTMLHPRLILLTNRWVWNSPVFGGVVRLAGYYPVMDGAEEGIDRLKKRVAEGYSIVVFPEGTRSTDGKIGRFHKGAFFLAEQLELAVQPIVIHGAAQAIPKGTLHVNDSQITLKFLPRVWPDDPSPGDTYSERTKSVSRWFKNEYANLDAESRTPHRFRKAVINNYIYKGPVLEWYMRVKLRLERDYALFDKLVPANGSVLDLGCGYGFLCYMLQFLSKERTITGVDYDEHKIETAQHGFSKSSRLKFVHGDVTTFQLEKYDCIIISDVLHYLTQAEQDGLVGRCFDSLNVGGTLIIRDGNSDLTDRHRGTWLTELLSVRVLGFNKARNELNFVSGKHLQRMASERGLEVSVVDETTFTSNVIFVITKPAVHETV